MAKNPLCAPRPGNSALVAHGCMGRCGAIHCFAHCKHTLFYDLQAEGGKNFA
jgi:hypothetical protein